MELQDMDAIFLKQWRIYADLTQEELGRRMGITGTQISRIESGKRDFDGRFLRAFKTEINSRLDEFDVRGTSFSPPLLPPLLRIRHIADALSTNPDPSTWVHLLQRLERNGVLPDFGQTLPVRSA